MDRKPKIRELRHERHQLLQEGREILDKAEEQRRALTTQERARMDEIETKADRLSREIEERELRARRDEPDPQTRGAFPRPHPSDGNPGGKTNRYQNGPDFWAPLHMRGADGREIRSYGHGERIAPDFRGQEVNGVPVEEVSLGEAIIGLATNDWSHREAERRALGEGTPSAGGVAVSLPVAADIIDLARDVSALSLAGVRTLPMQSQTLKLPTVASDPTPSWKAENAAGSESEGSFDSVDLTARTLFAYTKLSKELAMDSPAAAGMVERQLAAAMAQEWDRAGLFGSGTPPEPTGLFNVSGLGVDELGSGAGATLADYQPFSRAYQALLEANRTPGAVIMAPRTWGTIDRFVDQDGNPLRPPMSWEQIRRKVVASKVPVDQTVGGSTDCSTAFVGDFGDLVMGIRMSLEVLVSEVVADASSSAFGNFQVWVRAAMRLDFAVLRIASFQAITGIRP